MLRNSQDFVARPKLAHHLQVMERLHVIGCCIMMAVAVTVSKELILSLQAQTSSMGCLPLSLQQLSTLVIFVYFY